MAIKFACPHCKKTLSVKDEFAGKKGTCPGCKKVVMVPAVTAPAASPGPLPAPKPGAKKPADLEELAVSALSESRTSAGPQSTATIDFTCPSCDAELHLPVDLGGKQHPCPSCKRIIKVPMLTKTEPRDWRKPEERKMPSGAKREEEKLEGAWGTETTRTVSREALMEAEVIVAPREPVGIRRWIIRGVLAATVLGLVVGGTYWVWSYFQARSEEDAVQAAEAYLQADKVKLLSQPQQAELQRALAEYYYRAGDRKKGLGRLTLARQAAFADTMDSVERRALLRELLRTQVEFDIHIATGTDREKENDAATGFDEIKQTLSRIEPEGVRADAVRELVRTGLKSGKMSDEDLAMLIRGSVENDPEKLACLSILGQELVAANPQAAKARAEEAKQLCTADGPYPGALLTLLLMLKNPELHEFKKELESRPDSDAIQAAKLEAQLRSGESKPGPQDFEKIRLPKPRLDALVTCAAILVDDKNDGAKALLEEARKLAATLSDADTLWQRQKMVELAIAAGDQAFAKQVADALPACPLKSRALLALLQAELQQAEGSFDAAQAKPLGHPQSAAEAVAITLIARHNTRQDAGDTWTWAESLEPEANRPFAAIGVALGMRDK